MGRLTGSALVAHYEAGVKAGAGKKELAESAGYVRTNADGTTSVEFTAFNDALLAAKGLVLGKATTGKRGRELSYETAVLAQGHAVIGQGYLAQIGAVPGGRLAIAVKGKRLTLEAIASDAAADATAESAAA